MTVVIIPCPRKNASGEFYIHYTSFDLSLFESLSDLVRGSFSDWSWSKALIPISLEVLGVRRASWYASAAFIISLDECKVLVSDILSCSPPISIPLAPRLEDLATATGRVDWSSLEEVVVPLQKRAISRVVYQAHFDDLINHALDVGSKALALSTAIPHAGV